ncbi:MAG TPA: hypothetical protein VFY12_00780 [Arenimonas sp.]|nr:hypothetical protein [Arenimonas sp.]
MGLARDPLVTPHAGYLSLGATAIERASAYRDWLYGPIHEDDLARIRRHVEQERALGNPRFQAMVAKALNRPVHCRPPGRPAKQAAAHLARNDG